MNKNITFILGAICGIAGTYYTLKSKYEADLEDMKQLYSGNLSKIKKEIDEIKTTSYQMDDPIRMSIEIKETYHE